MPSRALVKLSAACVSILACSWPCVSEAATAWRPASGITKADIKKQYDCQWFHISQTCNLRAKGEDYDEYSTDGKVTWHKSGNHIALGMTTWTGTGLLQNNGDEVSWKHDSGPTGAGGVTITATIKDSTGPEPEANDSDTQATEQMYAFEAVATLNSNPGGSSTTISETGATKSDSITLFTLYDHKTATSTNGQTVTASINKYASATWSLDTNPNAATLGTGGQLQAGIAADVRGTFWAKVNDDDWADGAVSVAIGAFVGTPAGISAAINFNLGSDEAEGVVGMTFGFCSHDLGSNMTGNNLSLTSESDDPIWGQTYTSQETGSSAFGYANTVTLMGAKGKQSTALAQVEADAEAYTRDSGDDARAEMKVDEVADPSRPGINMPAHATYGVSAATYSQGNAPMPAAEEGY